MVTACRPLREIGGLPPRRSELVQAAAAAPRGNDWGSSINVPLARDRMLETFEREQLPDEVRSTLAAALNGDLHFQHLLFTAMIDTWPKLQKAIDEIARKVTVAPWKIVPYAMRGEKPDAAAEKMAKEVEALVWGMKPRTARLESGLEETITSLVRGYYYGHSVSEIRWERRTDGMWAPRSTKAVAARFYGYPYGFEDQADPEDRLMFDPDGMTGARSFVDFPEHRFLIGIHAGHAGHPATAAPLRTLAGYWLAAVYGLKWFLNFTQLYGIPWRHAEVADSKDENIVKTALASIGANGYIVTKPGTKINILAPGATSGESLPQKALIDLADQQCDQFILGQTLTSGTDKSGSRALGEVHQNTLDRVVEGVADYVGGILTHQLIPAIVTLNWGERDDLPEMWAKPEEEDDTKASAERMKILTDIGVPMSEAYVYDELGIPIPAAGDKLFAASATPSQPSPNGGPGEPVPGGRVVPPHETKGGVGNQQPGKPEKVSTAEAALAIVKAGGFRTLDDGRVIYIEKTHSESASDGTADRYRQYGNSPGESSDKQLDREKKPASSPEPSAADLRNPDSKPDDEREVEDSEFEKARKQYEQEQLEESMAGFPEIGKEMKGKLPRPEDLPADDPLRGEVENIWNRFKKETRNEDGNGRSVIAPSGAAQFFAPKGTKVNLDDLRQSMNEQGFDFQTPGDMLHAVYESLEGRKSWGTRSRGDFDVAAADASEVARLEDLMKQAEAAMNADGMVDDAKLASLFGAAWISGAKG